MVSDFLNKTFPNQWIGRSGPTPWLPSLFFLWGYVKDKVHRTPVCDIKTLQSQIINVFATVSEEMLGKTRCKIEYHLDILRAQMEHMLKFMNSSQI